MNRTEEKRFKKEVFREKSKHIAIILICIVLFMSMIYITDTATSRMLQKSDDKYAFYVGMKKEGVIRLDIAGETIEIYIRPIIKTIKGLYIKIRKGISVLHIVQTLFDLSILY